MNPFDLTGPEFLLFFATMQLASAGVVYLFWLTLGDRERSRCPMTDPYQIAYLRGGPREAIRIAAVSLAHRGLLVVGLEEELRPINRAYDLVSNELERSILRNCEDGPSFRTFVKRSNTKALVKSLYQRSLAHDRLVMNEFECRAMDFLRVTIILMWLIVAGVKIGVAFQRGRYNVMFLVILTILGAVLLSFHQFWYTPKGKIALRDLKILFKGLKEIRNNLSSTTESRRFSFLVAVFGIGVLSVEVYSFITAFRYLWVKEVANKADNSCSSSSCSSSSCSSSCGGGCGGCSS